jgi:hypothetical protein
MHSLKIVLTVVGLIFVHSRVWCADAAQPRDALPALERLAQSAESQPAGPDAAKRIRSFAEDIRTRGVEAWSQKCAAMYALSRVNEFTPANCQEIVICFLSGEDCKVVSINVCDENGTALATCIRPLRVGTSKWGEGVFYGMTGLYITMKEVPKVDGEGLPGYAAVPMHAGELAVELVSEKGFRSQRVPIRLFAMPPTTQPARHQ